MFCLYTNYRIKVNNWFLAFLSALECQVSSTKAFDSVFTPTA
ncbi:hypothetical protein HPELS_06685 [Helicobacter pylori ELS37]|uniref:Uncharacterized protein n=1 Tax=Helicobacter pylori ELS37 TaxID=1055527 RepID=A0ABC7ZH72_HELPX|nr:hypothetical protein HPELS_06685 [Helicobacter pylori ELS37]